jgi:two-component system, chemotaxis family, chemotaxis protein CheY
MSFFKKKILVVDDERTHTDLIKAFLEKMGFSDVTCRHDSLETFRVLKGNQEQALYDCVITDHNMPLMSGGELVRAIRELAPYKKLPIVLVSGDVLARPVLQNLALDHGVCFLAKPFTYDDFCVTLSTVLNQ